MVISAISPIFAGPDVDHISGTECTESRSQGRAKLRAFPHHLARENTQLSPSLTPTLGKRYPIAKPMRYLHILMSVVVK